MRQLIAAEYLSLDGGMEDPGPAGDFDHRGWTMPYWNDELAKHQSELLFASDALLLGRVTYEEFVAAWPTRSGDPFTDQINSMPKFVASRTLTRATDVERHATQGRCRGRGSEAEAAGGKEHPDLRQQRAGELADAASADSRLSHHALSDRLESGTALLQRRRRQDRIDAHQRHDDEHGRRHPHIRASHHTLRILPPPWPGRHSRL
jgi:dihydrofolate reductase